MDFSPWSFPHLRLKVEDSNFAHFFSGNDQGVKLTEITYLK